MHTKFKSFSFLDFFMVSSSNLVFLSDSETFVNANFNLNIFQRLKLSTDNLSGMTDQVILNLILAQLARLGEAKEFKSNI